MPRCGECPVDAGSDCPGVGAPWLCGRAEFRAHFVMLAREEAEKESNLRRVAACPDRGAVLPVSAQPECGCAELTECRGEKGPAHRPGVVTLRECLTCVREGSGVLPTSPP